MNEQRANLSSKRVRRSRSDVVDAALGILDDQGLPDLTMRHLAEVLGVRPSALYWHFKDKQSLLAAVSSRILAPLRCAEASSPSLPGAASALGTQLRECLLAHRDGAELVSSSLALGLIEPPLRTAFEEAARRLGESEAIARIAAEAITHFVIGYAFHEQQRIQAAALGALGVWTPEHAEADAADNPAPADFSAVLDLIVTGLSESLRRSAPSLPPNSA